MLNAGRPSFNYDLFQLPGLPPLSSAASRVEKRRYRRDLLIHLAYRQGFTQQFIADALHMSLTLVRSVIYRMAAYAENPEKPPRRQARPWSSHEPALSPGASPKKRRRARRDLMICLVHQHGLSQRFIAEAFDLARSHVHAIIVAGCADESRAGGCNTDALESAHPMGPIPPTETSAIKEDRPSRRRPGHIPGP
jgi:hypothetical protein